MKSLSFGTFSALLALGGQAIAHPGHGAASAGHHHWTFYAAGLLAFVAAVTFLRAKRS